MKNLILTIVILVFGINLFAKDINPDIKPEPLASTGFTFPDYVVVTMANGLKVYIVQDKEQPTVAFRLMVFGGTSVEGKKAGVADLMSGMLTKGTKTRNASQIASTMDGIGASLSSSATTDYYTVYAEGLKKHQKLILEVMSDVLLNPTFPMDEFIKLQQQTLAGIQYEKSNSGTIAQALSRMAIYGSEHPYSQRKTEASVNSLNVNDLKEYHSLWTNPENASLAVVGDINPNEIVKELETLFKNWKKGKTPNIEVPAPSQMPKGVYFVNRPGSVQSSLIITSNTVPYNNLDFDKLGLAAQVIGGANGRLYKTLREKHSFTYSPYGFHTSTKYANRFAAVAEVATAKTDSSVAVIFGELNDLMQNKPSKEELESVRTSFIGNYNMSFENSLFIASLIQNEEFYGKRINEIKNYTSKLLSLVPDDITTIVQNYINPANAQIIVVGDPSIVESLEKYGQVYKYDLDLNPLTGKDAKIEKINLSVDELISKYEKALGGKTNIQKILTLNAKSEAELSAGGQVIPGLVFSQKKAPNKLYNMSDFGVFKSEVWIDGENAWSAQSGQPAVAKEGNEKERMMFEAELFSVLALKKYGYKLEVLGKQGNFILMSAIGKSGNESTYYFNTDTYLLDKLELYVEGNVGIKEIWSIISEDYALFEGVMLPKTQITKTPNFTITQKTSYELNKEAPDEVFIPQK